MVNAEWIVVNLVGNCGVFLIILAYFLLNLNKLKADTLPYLVLNICGAVFIGVSLIYNFNLPSAVIEVCWFLISFVGLLKLGFKRWKSRKKTSASESSESLDSPGESGAREEDTADEEKGACRSTLEQEVSQVSSEV